jgi:hypothetical protein
MDANQAIMDEAYLETKEPTPVKIELESEHWRTYMGTSI